MDENVVHSDPGGIGCKDIRFFLQIGIKIFPPLHLGDVGHGSTPPTGSWEII